MTARGPTFDGRVVILAAAALYLGALTVARQVWDVDLWPWLGVGSGPSLFYDARNVAAAADCWSLGYDPLVSNPCDPSGRVMNYPRVWVLLHFLGVTQGRTMLFATVVIALFLLALLALVGRIPLRSGLVVAAAATSPAVMFAVERGNMDLVVFAVLVLAVFAWRARTRLTSFASPALVLSAAVAKYYAVLALPAFVLMPDRRSRWAAPAGVGIMGVYLIVTRDDVAASASAPEGGRTGSFGARILIGYLYHRVASDDWEHGNLLAQGVAVLVLAVMAAAAWVWARRRLPPLAPIEQADASLLAFYLGALIYLGTFALRRNGDYRLVFLLLTLPMLLQWAGDAGALRRAGLARAALVVIVGRLWLGGLSKYISPAHELLSWAIAGVFIALLAASVPRLGRVGATVARRRLAGAGSS